MKKEHRLTVTVQKGETLFDALDKLNMAPSRPCGGTGVCGLCKVDVKNFGMVKACQFKLAGTYDVCVTKEDEFSAVSACDSFYANAPTLVIDIGTTTVAWAFFNKEQEIKGGFVNPQRTYGADVLSRIKQALEGHLNEMQQILKERLSKEIQRGLDSYGDLSNVNVYVVGNTTMLHIINGWDCSGLGKSPFRPVSLAMRDWKEMNATITQLPGISAFVGADIVSGILATHMLDAKEPVLLIDLGTNGEMVIGGKGRLLVTSTAAGPAFEASELALSIHASGIMKALHRMRMEQAMDETGLLADAFFENGYTFEGRNISQELIRELQMAKAAIRAGIELLLKEYQVKEEEIGQVYLAGGMGYYIDPEDAIAIGLFPGTFRGKILSIGNSGMKGAIEFAKNPESAKKEVVDIVEHADELLLALHPDFEDLYIQYMSFPD